MGKLNIGRIPIMKGEFALGKSYNKLWQVTYLGSTYQSKIDNNTSSPATIVNGLVVHINVDKWLCIADATNAVNSKKELDNEVERAKTAENNLTQELSSQKLSISNTANSLQNQINANQSQINANQSQIVSNKQAQDIKNNSLEDNISKLNTRDDQISETLKSITVTGGASVATAVTYDNEKTKLVAVNVQSAIDEILETTAVKNEEGNIVDTPFKVIENEEFIHAITDSEDRLLFGIYRATGKPYFPLNEMYHVEQNEEFLAVWLDAADHVLFGIRRDGYLVGKFKGSSGSGSGIDVEDFNTESYPDFFQK